MLNKLLKYDLKYMIKNMSIFYILAILGSLLTRLFFSLKQTFIVGIISQICVGFMFSMVFSILINTIIRSWVRFKDSLYKDESYLTHTLPVSKTEIYESRFLQTVIFTIVGFVVMLISLFITYYTEERWIMLKDAINKISNGFNMNTLLFVILVIIILFLEIINSIQSGYLGIILGFRKNDNKVAFSFIFGIIGYILSQSFVILSLFIVGLFNNNIMSIFKDTILLDNSTIKLISILSITIYILLIGLMNIICTKELKKGVNVL